MAPPLRCQLTMSSVSAVMAVIMVWVIPDVYSSQY